MELMEKLKILSGAAKYDVSCSSSGSNRKNTKNGVGNAAYSGICHSFTSDGRCVSLLKILMTNMCMYDCKYCINRKTNDVKRALFTPEEIATLTINFYKRNYIEGLFLSSAVIKTPNYTMEKMIEAITLLRKKYKFNGYIHAKVIPGSSKELIDRLGSLVDRVSVNIELPSNESLKLLAPDKEKNNIIEPMKYIASSKKEHKPIARAGQTTQMIIGASNDSDYKILKLSEGLYNNFNLKRVYYSGYVPINHDEYLPTTDIVPLKRENRIYQADWLLRFYGFKVEDLLDEHSMNLNYSLDPKCMWALKNLYLFPIEINKEDYMTLLKVPGIGVISAKKIMFYRKKSHLTFENLKNIGVVMKRAKYFITCDGKYYKSSNFYNKDFIKESLLLGERKIEQLSIFGENNE